MVGGKLLKYLDYFFLIRPVLMPPVWTILLLGHRRSFLLYGESNLPGLILLLVTFSVGAIYILNQIFDIESDRLNQKLFFLAGGYISRKSALFETIFLFLVGMVPAFLISLQLGILFILGILFGLLYSVPPFSMKNRPVGGLISNALAHGNLTFLAGWSMNHPLSIKALFFSLPYMLAVGAIYLNTTIPDIEGDRKAGKITPAVRWGKKKVTFCSSLLVGVAIALSFLVRDLPLFVVSLLVFPLFLYSAFTRKDRHVIGATKLSILFLSIAAGIFYPWYFALLILGFVGTRLYYKARFNLDYPTFM